ncbi:MAG: cyanophycinase, partial [Saprospiraceae bacterium]|nr:cyanophycinase [Saprospiraceae bacterium]
YLSYWKNGPVAEALDFLIHTKKAVVGGTSAGMAVLGEACFSAQNGTVTSEEALSDPYGEKVTVEYGDFIHVPYLDNLITDTHYDGRNRYGRHVAFLARLTTDHQQRFRGIASEEYTAVCIDTTGLARVFGGFPESEDYAYFIQPNCNQPIFPEHCMPGKPLNWVRHEHALTVCKVAGKQDGSDTFQLTDWKTAPGSTWERWWVEQGVLKKAVLHKLPECVLDKH